MHFSVQVQAAAKLQAIELFQSHHRRWAKPIVDSISEHYTLLAAIEWSIESFQIMIDRHLIVEEQPYREWIHELRSICKFISEIPAAYLLERSDHVWIGEVVPVTLERRAVSRLFGALSLMVNEDNIGSRVQVLTAMTMLVTDYEDCWYEDRFTAAVSLLNGNDQ